MIENAFVFDAVRTPRGRGRPDGALHSVAALDLAAHCLRALRNRNRLGGAHIDDVILGIATPVSEQGGDLARFAALHAGFGDGVPGLQVHRFCASGLDACNIAAARVIARQADLLIAGGVEAMSRVPMGSDGGVMTSDPRITGPHAYIPQGVAADLLATLEGYSRDVVDAYAAESQRRASIAWREERFARSIVPMQGDDGRTLLERDEHMRPGATLESLGKLKPAFSELGAQGFDAIALARYPQVRQISHVHHAGNSSGVVDGAAAVLIGSGAAGRRLGLTPRARIIGTASIGSDPSLMLTGPEFVVSKLLERFGRSVQEVDLWEVNEAFASVVLRFQRALGIAPERVNVNGGAIAMGHPLGATGAVLVGTLIDELERTQLRTGVVVLCAAGGQATACLLERADA